MSNSYRQCIEVAKKHVATLNTSKRIVVFDIGCNINAISQQGPTVFLDDFTSIALQQFKNVHMVYAYEPVHWQRYEEAYKELSMKVSLNKKAVSNTRSSITFFSLVGAHGLSSAFNRACFKNFADVHETTVEATTIDHEMERLKLSHIDYLKVDTEGSELNVLRGAVEALAGKAISCVQLEHGGTYEDAGYSENDISSLLSGYGYSLKYKNGTELLYTV